ncbi:hypothetical protein Hdeb2414_s0010g00350501 [Helianthus debilis subsp. tardiflorus]
MANLLKSRNFLILCEPTQRHNAKFARRLTMVGDLCDNRQFSVYDFAQNIH